MARLFRDRGAWFDACYAVASTTTPCFGSILTGLYPVRSGLRSHRGDKLGRDVRTVAQLLRETGYDCAAHVTGPLGPETDLGRGFDPYHFRDRHETIYTSFGNRLLRRVRAAHDRYPAHNFFPANRDHAFHVYEFLVRIPCVWLVPGLDRAVHGDCLCSQIDVAPTMLDLAGIPAELEGRSLRPGWTGAGLPDRPVFFEAVGGRHLELEKLIAGVRFGRWKFMHAPNAPAVEAELFDLEADAFEETNLAAVRPEVVSEARGLIAGHYARTLSADARVRMSADEEAIVTQRLKDLGYIE